MSDIQELETKPIGALLWQFALPAVISQVVASVYNIVDRIFLGQNVGGLAIAGLAITMPVMNVIHAFGSLVGAGAGARMSIVLGRKDYRWAEKILGNSMLLTFFFGALFLTAGYLFMNPILEAFGATDDTVSFAREYMLIVLPGMFFTTLSFNLTGLMRSSGSPTKSMWIMAGGALLNIGLDALFIVALGWGIAGAAWATTLSMVATSVAALLHFMNPKSLIRFKRHAWAPKFYIFRNILAIGISPFLMNVAASAVTALLNRQLIRYGGDAAVGALGCINSFASLIFMLIFGICQGMQPISGYNYGAGHNHRLREVYLLTVKVTVLVGIVGTALAFLLPTTILRLFNNAGDATADQILAIGRPAMYFYNAMMPVIAFTVVTSQLFQSIDKPWISIVTSLSRQVLILTPMMFLVPYIRVQLGYDGLTGVWMSDTISDLLGGVLAAVLLWANRRVFRPGYQAPERRPRKEAGPSGD